MPVLLNSSEVILVRIMGQDLILIISAYVYMLEIEVYMHMYMYVYLPRICLHVYTQDASLSKALYY